MRQVCITLHPFQTDHYIRNTVVCIMQFCNNGCFFQPLFQSQNTKIPSQIVAAVSSQLTATKGSTERMSVLPVRTCLAVKSTCVSFRLWDFEAWPGWDKACLGLDNSWLSGQAIL